MRKEPLGLLLLLLPATTPTQLSSYFDEVHSSTWIIVKKNFQGVIPIFGAFSKYQSLTVQYITRNSACSLKLYINLWPFLPGKEIISAACGGDSRTEYGAAWQEEAAISIY